MKKNRLFAVMTVLAVSASSVFGQFKIYNSELLKIGNVNEQAKITRGFEVSMPEVLMQAGNTGIRFAEGKVRNGGLWYQSQFSYSYGIVPLENLPSGMYLVRVVWEGYSVTKKLIVQ